MVSLNPAGNSDKLSDGFRELADDLSEFTGRGLG